MGFDIDVNNAIKDISNLFKSKQVKSVPVNTFFRRVEQKIKHKLNPESRRLLLSKLEERGAIITKDDQGNGYVDFLNLENFI